MSSANSKLLIFGTLSLVATGMYFAAVQFSTEVDQIDPMSEFRAAPAAPTPSSQGSSAELAPVDVMLVGLKQRLEKQPGDIDGWVLLSKSYYHLNQWQEAQGAFEKAKALGYAGSWQPLPRIDSFSQNSSSLQSFDSSINFRDYKTNENERQVSPEESAGLKLKVSLNPALQKILSPESPVFVFVRAAESSGPPLAVVRRKVAELPFDIALNDSHAMIPGRTISGAENVIVGARISMSGNPERHPGDYEQLSASIPSNSEEPLELVIKDKI